jgi:DtxR family transcriptional regulator, Mn-dependent transcriptional regulator
MNKKNLSPSIEDYLEAVYKLNIRNKKVRVKDIADDLDISPSSVTEVLHKLVDLRLINHKRYGKVDLTKEGEEIARKIFNRHKLVVKFLTSILGVDEKTAQKDSCKIEHSVSDETVTRLVQFIEFLKLDHKDDKNWADGFKSFLEKKS